MALTTLGVAIVVVVLTKLLYVMDVASAVSAFVANSGAVSEMSAAVLGMLVAIMFWWGIAFFLLSVRVPRRAGGDFDAG